MMQTPVTAQDILEGRELEPAPSAAVYHLMAVQDWGGSQEWWVDWPVHLTRADAEAIAADMADADRAYLSGDLDDYLAGEARYSPKYGDDWHKLISTNVCPGWDAIFIERCPETCKGTYGGELSDPFWRPAPSTPTRHLHLV